MCRNVYVTNLSVVVVHSSDLDLIPSANKELDGTNGYSVSVLKINFWKMMNFWNTEWSNEKEFVTLLSKFGSFKSIKTAEVNGLGCIVSAI